MNTKKIFEKIQYLVIFGFLFLPVFSDAETGESVTLDNPIKGVKTIDQLIAKILETVITIATPIAILAIIYSGFLFVKAQGNPKSLEEAREILKWTLIGIAVLLGAKLLATVISGTITSLGVGV
ncbi:MAG: hypothetical protein ABIG87_01310 [Patescibacteria group bacterium]